VFWTYSERGLLSSCRPEYRKWSWRDHRDRLVGLSRDGRKVHILTTWSVWVSFRATGWRGCCTCGIERTHARFLVNLGPCKIKQSPGKKPWVAGPWCGFQEVSREDGRIELLGSYQFISYKFLYSLLTCTRLSARFSLLVILRKDKKINLLTRPFANIWREINVDLLERDCERKDWAPTSAGHIEEKEKENKTCIKIQKFLLYFEIFQASCSYPAWSSTKCPDLDMDPKWIAMIDLTIFTALI